MSSVCELPYADIAKEAASGKRVVVFCDNFVQLKRVKRHVASAARALNTVNVTCSLRNRRVDVGRGVVCLFLTNGIDGRGYTAEVVYLSESARMQQQFASLMRGELR